MNACAVIHVEKYRVIFIHLPKYNQAISTWAHWCSVLTVLVNLDTRRNLTKICSVCMPDAQDFYAASFHH
jgi:hypothetical protein